MSDKTVMILATQAQYALLDTLAGREKMTAMRVVEGDVSELQRQFNQEFARELGDMTTNHCNKHNYGLRLIPIKPNTELFRITAPNGDVIGWCENHIAAEHLCELLDKAVAIRPPALNRLDKPGFIQAAGPVTLASEGGPDYELLEGDRLAVESARPGWQIERAGEMRFVDEDDFYLIKREPKAT